MSSYGKDCFPITPTHRWTRRCSRNLFKSILLCRTPKLLRGRQILDKHSFQQTNVSNITGYSKLKRLRAFLFLRLIQFYRVSSKNTAGDSPDGSRLISDRQFSYSLVLSCVSTLDFVWLRSNRFHWHIPQISLTGVIEPWERVRTSQRNVSKKVFCIFLVDDKIQNSKYF